VDSTNPKTNPMENNDLGSKKMNNKQNTPEEFTNENLPKNYDPTATKLVAEVETNSSGEQKIVHRARNVDANPEQNSSEENQQPSCSVALLSDKETQRMIENKDHNSDITAHRYPNSNPDNQEDRGNIKLDE
jgi:hypothetical protein